MGMGWGDTDTQVRGPKSFSLQKHKPALFRFFSFCSALLCSHFSLPSVFFPFWAPRISYHSHPHCLMICKCRFISHLPFFFSSPLVVGECFLFFVFFFSFFFVFVFWVFVICSPSTCLESQRVFFGSLLFFFGLCFR